MLSCDKNKKVIRLKFSRLKFSRFALERHALEHHVLELSLNKVTIDEIEFEVLRNTTHIEEDSFMSHTHLVHEYLSVFNYFKIVFQYWKNSERTFRNAGMSRSTTNMSALI